jgi:hypothetical protein
MRFAAGGAFGDERKRRAQYERSERAPLEYYCVDNKRVF